MWADTVTLTSAQIKNGTATGSDSYKTCTATDGGGNTWNAYAIKNQHSNSTSDYHYWQIKKYEKSTAYYVQVPTLGTKVTQLKITVSNTSNPITGGGNKATLYFSSSKNTSTTGTGVASGTGASEVTIDCSSLNLNTGYITASGGIRIWNIEVTYTTGGGSAPDPVASIDLESNSIKTPAAGASGTIKVTYNNITDVASEVQFFKADGTTPATYDWIDAEINASNNVAYTIETNTGAARTAYMKVYALDDETNDVYSELITITQAEYEIPASWAAVTSIADLTASDVFVIVGDKGGSTFALSNDKGTSAAPTAVAVTVANNALSGIVADNIKWNISGNATDGYTFYPDGDSEKWLYCTNTNNGVRVGTNENKTFKITDDYLKHTGTSRYVGIYNSQDWRCYTTINDNIKDQTFAFYKKLAVKFNGEGYATFSSTCAIDYSKAEGYTVWVVSGVSGTTITFSQVKGAVPAGTGVLLMGTAGETVYPEVAASGVAPAVNKLQGITTTTAVVADAYYGLSGAEFVKVNAGTVPAGKALLPAGAVNGVKALSFRFDGADGISEIMSNGENEKMSAIYDLSGRRVVKPTKGLYIVNGKKVVK